MLGGKALFLLLTFCLVPMALAETDDTDHHGQDFAPSASPDGRMIAYYAYRGAPGQLPDLYVVEIETGVERQITNTPGLFEIEPTWSADGKRIYFAAGPTMNELALYSIAPDGSDYRLFYDGKGEGPPGPPSKHKLMVFWESNDDGTSDLMVHDFATGHNERLETGLGGKNTAPVLSPNGQELVFSHRDLDENGIENKHAASADALYVMRLHDRAVRKLTPEPTIAYSPAWSPGGQIFFMGPDEKGVMHIYKVRLAGGTPVRVTAPDNAPAYFPAISHDGRHLLFSGRVANGRTRTLKMPIQGGPPEQVTRIFVN